MTPEKMIERTKELADRLEAMLSPPAEPVDRGEEWNVLGSTPQAPAPDPEVLALRELVAIVASLASTVGSLDGNAFRTSMRLQAIEEERGTSAEAGHRRNLQKAFELMAVVEAQLPVRASARRAIKRARRSLEKAIGRLAAEGETKAGEALETGRESRRAKKGATTKKKSSRREDEFDAGPPPAAGGFDEGGFDDDDLAPGARKPNDADDDDSSGDLDADDSSGDLDDKDEDDDLLGDAGPLPGGRAGGPAK